MGQLPSKRPGEPESDREWFAQLLEKQTDDLRELSDIRDRAYDARFTALEKSSLSNDRLALRVEQLLDTERKQDQDIGALRERVMSGIRPAVVAEANTEGQAAGLVAGNRAGKFWGVLGAVFAIVVSGAIDQCQKQIARGAFDASPASSR